jgi:hypothetical protein
MPTVKFRILTDEERDLVRALYRDHLETKERLAVMDREILDLMERRDAMWSDYKRTSVPAIAEKMGCSKSHVVYCCRPRSSHMV